MTVSELIQKLQEMPQDVPVACDCPGCGDTGKGIERVEFAHGTVWVE